MLIDALGGGVIGNTTGSGSVIEGSSPSPRARAGYALGLLAPSSRGLGRRPLKPVTPVRIRSGLPLPSHPFCESARGFAIARRWALHVTSIHDQAALRETSPILEDS